VSQNLLAHSAQRCALVSGEDRSVPLWAVSEEVPSLSYVLLRGAKGQQLMNSLLIGAEEWCLNPCHTKCLE